MTREIDEDDLTVGKPKRWAGGLPGVLVSLKRSVEQMGTTTTIRTLRLLNQCDGFDCPGCAWPEPREVDGGKRRAAEFCENGAKAVAEEATTRRVGPEFFAAHSLADLDGHSEYWLGQQGRLTHPVVKLLLPPDPPAEQPRRQPAARRRRTPRSVVGGPRPGHDPASAAVDRPRVR